jgi:hypothetical protein
MSPDLYLKIHAFSNPKLEIEAAAYSHLSSNNPTSHNQTPSGKRSNISFHQYQTELSQSKDFWLDANERGYERNYEVIEMFRDITGSVYAKPIGAAIDPVMLPTLVLGVEIANALLYVEHKVFEMAINYHFD